MLNPLILNGCPDLRDVKIQALAAKPFRAVLVQDVRIVLSDGVEEAQLMFPFWLYDSIRGQLCTDFCPLKAPVGLEPVFFFVKRKIRVPPLEKRHDDPGEVQEEVKL